MEKNNKVAISALNKVEKLLRKGWCKVHVAEDSLGIPRLIMDPLVVRYCLIGALNKAFIILKVPKEEKKKITQALVLQLPDPFKDMELSIGLAKFNDSQTTYEPVVMLVEKAKEALKR